MIHPLTSVTGDAGVNGVGLLVNTRLGWYFRPQPVADVGVDAQVEPVLIGMIGAAVGAVLTAVHLLVTGARELWDEIASFGGKSDPQYDIQIRVKAACLSATEFAKNAYPFDTGADRLEKAEVLRSVTYDGGYAATSQVRYTLVGEDGSRSSYVNWVVLKNNNGKWEYHAEGTAPVDAACTDPGSLLLKTPPAIRRAAGCR